MGHDLTLDFMYSAPHSNLFTNIQMGAASEPFGWTVRGQVGVLVFCVVLCCVVCVV